MEWHWETQKKIWEKRVGKEQVVQPNGTSWYKMVYVEQVVQGEVGLQIKGSVQLNLSTYSKVGLQGRVIFN